MKNKEHFNKALQKAFRYLSFRDRTEKEMLDYLQKKGYKKELSEEIVLYLNKNNYLDDELFAERWSESRFWSKGVGPRKINQELKMKGIDSFSFCVAADEETKVMVPMIRKYLPQQYAIDDYRLYCKAGNYLLRRGFREDSIRKALDEFFTF